MFNPYFFMDNYHYHPHYYHDDFMTRCRCGHQYNRHITVYRPSNWPLKKNRNFHRPYSGDECEYTCRYCHHEDPCKCSYPVHAHGCPSCNAPYIDGCCYPVVNEPVCYDDSHSWVQTR